MTYLPFFSIIIPVHKRLQYLKSCIASVLGQTFQDFEIILVDNGSKFNDEYSVNPKIKLIRLESNIGPSAARNSGASIAKGEYLVFLDDDDIPDPNWLAGFHSKAITADCEVACCGCQNKWEDGTSIFNYPKNLGILFKNQVGLFLAGTFAINRKAFDKIGGYDDKVFYGENTELSFKVAKNDLRTKSIAESLITVRKYPRKSRRQNYSRTNVLNSVVRVLETHESWLVKDPKILANYYSIAGVSSIVTGNPGAARKYFVKTIKLKPFSVKTLIRILLTFSPEFYVRRLNRAGYSG